MSDTQPPPPADSQSGVGPDHRSGFVAIVGRPNVGKSTLLNALMREPVAVATKHPQTTRERLLGIWTEPDFQVILVDTPGIHRARCALNKYMVKEAVAGARDVDVVLLLAEAPAVRNGEAAAEWKPGAVALEALETIKVLGHPIILVLTKIDRLHERTHMIPVLDTWAGLHDFAAIVPTAALEEEGLDLVKDAVLAHLPLGPRYYEAEHLTDRPLRWHVAELVRAELFVHLRQELPYSCAVKVTEFKEGVQSDRIHATIFVERDSQKGVVVGKGGRTIKALREGATERIRQLSGRPCQLRLNVDVARNWTRDPSKLGKLGYTDSKGTGQ